MSPGSPFIRSAVAEEIDHLRRSWGWLLFGGILLVLAGIVALAFPFLATVSSIATIGVLLLVAAVVQIASAFVGRSWGGALMALVCGALYAFAGVVLLRRPLLGAVGFTLFLTLLFFAVGVGRITAALLDRFSGWGWTVLNGVVSITLALLVWRNFPEAAFWVIGMFVGIELIFAGWAWIMLAAGLHHLPGELVSHRP